MEIRTTATNRKDTAKAIGECLGEKAVYLGPPTFAYQIGEFRLDRDGMVMTEDSENGETVRRMLVEKGLAEPEDGETAAEENTVVTVPFEGMALQGIINLMNMIHSKQYLINRAIGREGFYVGSTLIGVLNEKEFQTVEEVISQIRLFADICKGITVSDKEVTFDGFPYTEDGDTVKAYCELAAKMVAFAKKQKRIRETETIEENEKYYMRAWLVRLGFSGREAKQTKKVLLEKLKGHTAFRTEADKEKWNARQKENRAAAERGGE